MPNSGEVEKASARIFSDGSEPVCDYGDLLSNSLSAGNHEDKS